MFKNHFDLLGLWPEFEIDKEKLYQNYINLQQLLHPDKLKPHAEKIFAMEYTAKLNNAYQTLNDDKKRAEYLLSLHNIIINQEEHNNINPEPEMLNEILELSEEPQKYDIKLMKKECLDIFKHNYAIKNFQTAALAIVKLQYLNKIEIT